MLPHLMTALLLSPVCVVSREACKKHMLVLLLQYLFRGQRTVVFRAANAYITSTYRTASPSCSLFSPHFTTHYSFTWKGKSFFFSFQISGMVAWTQCQCRVLCACRIQEKTLGTASISFSI